MSVAFNQIPINIRTPGTYVEFDPTRAVQGLPVVQHKMLVIGQRLASGAVLANVPTRITSSAQAEQAFGRGSMLASMLKALRAANGYTECWAVAIDDNPAGAAAVSYISCDEPPTVTGAFNFYVAGELVQVAVTAGMTTSAFTTAVAAAVNANTALAVSAVDDGLGLCTLNAKHKGESGNSIDLRRNYFGEPILPGVRIRVSNDAGPEVYDNAQAFMDTGAGNPSIATALAAVGDEQYHTVVMPYTDAANLGRIEAFMSARFGPMVQKEGHCFTGICGTLAQASTLGDSRNSPHLTIMASGKSPTPAYIWAAVAAAVDAYEPDPARPRQTLPLPGLLPPATPDRLTREERNLHLFDGISTTVADAGGQVLIERLITTYKTSSFGVPDISYLNIETLRTIAYLRFSVRARIGLRYPRHKLASDGTRFGAGQPVVTLKDIRNELVALFADWEEAGLAEGIEQFKRDLIVQRNGSDSDRLDAVIPPDVVNQFRVFAAQLQFRL